MVDNKKLENNEYKQLFKELLQAVDNAIPNAFINYGMTAEETLQSNLKRIVRKFDARQPQPVPAVDAKNLAMWLNAMMGNNRRSANMDPDRVRFILEKYLTLAVLKSDPKQVAVFDPYSGSWDTTNRLLSQLLPVIKSGVTKSQIISAATDLATDCLIDESYLTPYSGSRYVLFQNCVLDVKNDDVSSLEQADALKFVSRNRINLDYKEDPKLPAVSDGNFEWDPQRFLNIYTGGDKDKEKMLLFTLSLALFPNHSFGVNINYVSNNAYAISKLKVILENLLDSNLAEIPLGRLDEKFSLTNFNADLSSIWANGNGYNDLSNNTDLKSQYNTLALGEFHLQVKNEKDVIFHQSPQLYVFSNEPIHDAPGQHGEVFVKTMYYQFPEINDDNDTATLLALSDDYLQRASVMKWLVKKMLDAYKALAPTNEIQFSQFRFKADDDRLLSLFPKEYQQWQHDALAPKNQLADEVDEFIRYNIIPNLSTSFGKPTMMHRLVAYKLFKRYYNLQHGVVDAKINDIDDKLSPSQLENMLKKYLNQNGYSTPIIKDKSGNPARRIVNKPVKMNFDFENYIRDNGDPDRWFDNNHPIDPFGRKLNGWFQIYSKNKGGGNNG